MGRTHITAIAGALLLALFTSAQAAEEAAETTENPGAIQLFNGQDFDGWKLFIPEDEGVDPATVWEVRDGGILYCKGDPKGYIRTTTEYENYRLTFEWRWPEDGGNNGLLIHIQEPDTVWPKSIEGQLQAENAADLWVIGGAEFKEHTDPEDRRVPKMHKHNEKPLGEWNHYEAVCDGDTIRLTINGLLQNVATECTVTKGYIGLQSEGTPIEFRNIVLEPLEE
ncbi:MAG: hypothetical protein AMXMBFR82_40690 [Candidatus Hydrogenedentota bacterium]